MVPSFSWLWQWFFSYLWHIIHLTVIMLKLISLNSESSKNFAYLSFIAYCYLFLSDSYYIKWYYCLWPKGRHVWKLYVKIVTVPILVHVSWTNIYTHTHTHTFLRIAGCESQRGCYVIQDMDVVDTLLYKVFRMFAGMK